MMKSWCMVALALAASASVAAVQDQKAEQPEKVPAPAAMQPRESAAAVPLKVAVVISRHRGGKRLSSLPYELGVVANGPKTTLRMGSDVPIAQTVFGGAQPDSYTYRAVGTNIDCQAFVVSPGLFQLGITVADSSVHLDATDNPAHAAGSNVPIIRTFNSSFAILLRDGQATEYTSATDPVTGEVMKVELRLNVMK